MLGYGSQGTLVFEGSLHGRPVAVKRMLRHLYHLAKKEIDALILSDEVCHRSHCWAMYVPYAAPVLQLVWSTYNNRPPVCYSGSRTVHRACLTPCKSMHTGIIPSIGVRCCVGCRSNLLHADGQWADWLCMLAYSLVCPTRSLACSHA